MFIMGSSSMRIAAIVFYLCFLTFATFHNCFCNGNSNIVCSKTEKLALLKFKKDFKDLSNRLSSWAGNDCCQWSGVVCDNITGHVHEIHLSNNYSDAYCHYNGNYSEYEACWHYHELGGKINPSLLDLKRIRYLDLSQNDFGGIRIPSFIGSVGSLRYLNLSNAGFSGAVPHQLGNLTMIRYLDLSWNDFGGIRIPSFIGSIGSLRYLDLSNAGFSGAIPHQLGNLTMMRYLGLQGTFFEIESQYLHWVSGLLSLEHLDMSWVNLSKAVDWLEMISSLPSLVELHLAFCDIKYSSPSTTINSTSLHILDLFGNNFASSIPKWVFSLNHLVSLDICDCNFYGPIPNGIQNMTSLKEFYASGNNLNSSSPNELYSLKDLVVLDLGYNKFQGPIPIGLLNMTSFRDLDLSYNFFTSLQGVISGAIGNLTSLISLDLSHNQLEGNIPMSMERLSSMATLHLSYNHLNGTLPESLGQLAKLETLDVSHNLMEGVVSEIHFANLTRLSCLDGSGNDLTLKVHDGWIPTFQVRALMLASWQLGPQFPAWLQYQGQLEALDISNIGISDSIPQWFWPKISKFSQLNLSHNQIRGEIPRKFKVLISAFVIDLSFNYFRGMLPFISSSVVWLDFSNNSFLGSVYHALCGKIRKQNLLTVLNLGNNYLSGKIPNCWQDWQYLQVLKLENNKLIGTIPPSIGHLASLKSLHLRHNNLSGKLPQSLQHCINLVLIDLGGNEFIGSIPSWMGNSFLKLVVLNLRSNKFQGSIPYELCRPSSLQILDLAHNNLSKFVPKCFNNFMAMAKEQNSSSLISYHTFNNTSVVIPNAFLLTKGMEVENAFLVTKGREVEYTTTLNLVTSMDLSENNLSGEIPKGITSLVGLHSLNLSGNNFTGKIPENIGDMEQLESLDFSLNKLYGEIPLSMSNLTFLSHLNLSYNNLIGRIPLSTQLQSLENSSFVGNKLC
ncbi:hypothetical protein CsSME_00001272 [Camellia sinensis var. sinensis]